MMEKYIQALKEYALSHEQNYSDGESVLTILYEAYSEVNRMDDDQIKADFNALYQAMNEYSGPNSIMNPIAGNQHSGNVEIKIPGTWKSNCSHLFNVNL